LTVLVDYFGREVTDTLAVCRRFPDLAAAGQLAVRLDTHGGRYVEGLDLSQSYAILERRAQSAATAARPSCATWSAPASRPPRSGMSASRSTTSASRASASSPRPAS